MFILFSYLSADKFIVHVLSLILNVTVSAHLQTCLFGIAVMLWSAADYKMPTNQEPALSEEFENLLISMTQDNADLRPPASSVLEVIMLVFFKLGAVNITIDQL